MNSGLRKESPDVTTDKTIDLRTQTTRVQEFLLQMSLFSQTNGKRSVMESKFDRSFSRISRKLRVTSDGNAYREKLLETTSLTIHFKVIEITFSR